MPRVWLWPRMAEGAPSPTGYTPEDLAAVSDTPQRTLAELAAARPFAEIFPDLAAKIQERRARSDD